MEIENPLNTGRERKKTALDPRAEFEVHQNFHQMVSGKTALFISRRLSSSHFCDRIAVFRQGGLVECGTHVELIVCGGLYSDLFNMRAQFCMEEKAAV